MALREESTPLLDRDIYKATGTARLQQLYEASNVRKLREPDFGATEKYRCLYLNAASFCLTSQLTRLRNVDPVQQPVSLHPEISLALDWLASQQDGEAIIVVTDGRSSEVSAAMRAWHNIAAKDPKRAFDIWITYDMPASDLRNPRRQVAWSSRNRETWYIILPVQKRYLKKKMRTVGRGSGESSTFHSTYTGVPLRPLSGIPRLSLADKKLIVGEALDGKMKEGSRAAADVEKHGHALFWQDVMTPRTLAAIYNDLNCGCVFDLSPGAGTAALAACANDIPYLGVCANERHRKWLDEIINKMTLAVQADTTLRGAGRTDKDVKGLAAKIQEHFPTQLATAQRLLREDKDIETALEASEGESDSE